MKAKILIKRLAKLAALSILPLLVGLVGCGGGSDNSTLPADTCLAIDRPRIINGTACDSTNSPIVLVSTAPFSGAPGTCSGVLITANSVLTAAQCIPARLSEISITVGSDVVSAITVFIAPNFSLNQSLGLLDNDLAVITLSRAVSIAALPILASRPVAVGDEIAVYGYGLDQYGRQGTLQSGRMNVSDVTNSHLFAAFDGSDSNTCSGDAGGPAVVRFRDSDGAAKVGVVGTISSGINLNCKADDITAFANVQSDSALNFILSAAPSAGVI